MMKFDCMEPTVDEICRSLVEEPHAWRVETHTFYKSSDLKLWHGVGPVTETWNGRSSEVVFSYEQGWRIRRALDQRNELVGTDRQKQVVRDLGPRAPKVESTNQKPWWNFWS